MIAASVKLGARIVILVSFSDKVDASGSVVLIDGDDVRCTTHDSGDAAAVIRLLIACDQDLVFDQWPWEQTLRGWQGGASSWE